MAEPITASAITGLIGIFKALRAGLKELREGTLSHVHKDAVENISGLLIDAQDRLSDLQTESIEIRERNAELARRLAEDKAWTESFKDYNLVTTEGGAVVYQKTYRRSRRVVVGREGGDPEHNQHYICPSCVNDRKLQVLQDGRSANGAFECPGCSVMYYVKPTGGSRRPRPKGGEF